MTKSAAPSKLLDRGLALSTSAEGPAAQPAPLVATSKRKRAEEEAQIGDSQPAALEQAVETMSSVSVEATTEVTPAASENAVEAAADAGAASEAAESDRAAVMPWAKVALGGLGLVGAVAAAAGGDSKSSPSPQVPTGQEPGPSGEEPTGAGGETPAKPAPVAPTLEISGSNGTVNAEGGVKIGGLNPGHDWEYSLDGGKTWHPGKGDGVPADALTEGKNELIVVAVDKDGTRSEPAAIEITKDTQIAAPSVEGSNGTGPINGSGSITVGGIETGGKWDFSLDGGKTWTPGTGDSIPADALAEGDNHVTVRQTDPAGNQATSEINVVKDTQIAAPSVEGSNGTGPINGSGSITVGGIETGGKWDFSLDGGKTWTPGTGDSIPADALAEGDNHVTVRQTDPAGNQATSEINVVKDTQVAAPSVEGSNGTGPINGSGSITVGGIESGGKWDFSLDGGKTWTPGTGDSIPADALAEGDNHVTVRQTDPAGNQATSEINVAKDTTIEQPTLTPSNGTGPINGSGSITVGGIESGGKWDFSLDGGKTWVHGNGSTISADALAEGSNQVTVRHIDAAGNVATAACTVILDTAVAKPTLVMDDASVGPEKLGQNVVVGNLEAGATWEWRVHTSSGYSDWITGTGDQIATSLLPQNTVFAVWVRQTDLAGNQASSYLLGMMDTLAPEAPALQLAVDTGVSGTDSLTNNAQINVSGLEMGARWDFSLDNGATWTAGVGTSIASSALQEGANTVLVRQTDGAGNASAVTSISVTKDTQVAVPGVGTSTGTALIDVGDTLSISGIESGATWEYSLDGGSIWTAGTGMSINAESLNHGKNSVAIRQTDAAGNVATSDALIVTRNDPTPSVRLHNYENSDQSTYFVGDRDVTVHVVRADRAVATLDDLRDLGSAYGTMSTNSTGQAYVDGLENGAYRFYVASASGKLNEVHYANAGMTDVAATRLVVGGFGSFITMGSKVGSAGDDTMTGYLGVLTGGSGADTFRATDAGYLRLFLGDYNRAEGDVLDLSAVLSGATVDNLSGFLSKQVGANGQITLLLDASGTGNFQSDKFFVTLLNNHVAQDIALKLAGGSTAVI